MSIWSTPIVLLCLTAGSIGVFHTLLGPDHYLPFIAMGKARRWSATKVAWVTFLCGIGHVLSSVALGGIGIALGIAVGKLEIIEGFRGDLAAWALLVFGLLYMVWGIRRAWRLHAHSHDHSHGHVHESDAKNITAWVLFTIFVFGPCEPLIPILMYPAARESRLGTVLVAGVFAVATIGTMMTVVMSAVLGFRFVDTSRMDRYTHAIAGGTIALCGFAVVFLGL
jgi:sulfite exporter TauE/SafE